MQKHGSNGERDSPIGLDYSWLKTFFCYNIYVYGKEKKGKGKKNVSVAELVRPQKAQAQLLSATHHNFSKEKQNIFIFFAHA